MDRDHARRREDALTALSQLGPRTPSGRVPFFGAGGLGRTVQTVVILITAAGHAWWLWPATKPATKPATAAPAAQVVALPPAAPLLPAVPAEPQPVVVSVPTPLPQWPWGPRPPAWEDAQASPEAYGRWLEHQNPGYKAESRRAKITAYTPHEGSCGASADGRTAVMANAWTYGLAVPRALLRSWRRAGVAVHVPGYMPETYSGQAWVPDDCGSALDASWRRGLLHVDVRYMNEGWAFQHWGTRYGKVWILRRKQ